MTNNKNDFNFKNVDKIFEKIQKDKVEQLVVKKFGEDISKSGKLSRTRHFFGKLISKIKK